MRRREFVRLLGGAAAIPLAARAQQPAMPVIGYLNGASASKFVHLLAAFRQGLEETGYVEGRNVAIEYRFADGKYDRLPALAADLVQHRVAVIVATAGTPTVLAAKAATSTIPIVFVVGSDPVKFGVVASLNRPGGNATGMTLLGPDIVAKRLALLHELVSAATSIGALVNLANPSAALMMTDLHAAGGVLGRELQVVSASNESEIGTAFAALAQQHIGALLVSDDPFFDDRRTELVALVDRYRMPAIYIRREFVEAGGLMSYGPKIPESFRQAGLYTGRILRGASPADMPVQQPTKFELVINLKTMKALGIDFPATLLARADEVIE